MPRKYKKLLTWTIPCVLMAAGATWLALSAYAHRREANTRRLLVDAQSCAQQGRWADAVRLYRQYLPRNEKDVNALRLFALALRRNVKIDPTLIGDVVRTHERLLVVAPEDVEALEYLTYLYLQLHEYDRAAVLAESWRALRPNSNEAKLARARAHKESQEPEACVTLLKAILSDDPSFSPAYELLITTLVDELNDVSGARDWLQKALSHNGDDQNIRIVASGYYLRQGDPATAERHIAHARSIAGTDVNVLLAAAKCFEALNRTTDQRAVLLAATTLDPHNPAVLTARARFALRTLDQAELRSAAKLLLEHAAADPYRIAQAAELYFHAQDTQLTERCMEKISALTLRQDERIVASLAALRGAIALRRGFPRVAFSHLQVAINTPRPSLWALQLMAQAHTEFGDSAGAVRILDSLRAKLPPDSPTRSLHAELAWQAEDWRTAEAIANELEMSGPADTQLASLIRAACAVRRGRTITAQQQALAESIFQSVADAPHTPENVVLARWLVRFLFHAEKHADAKSLALSFLSIQPPSTSVALELSSIALRHDLCDMASELADRVLTDTPESLGALLVVLDCRLRQQDTESAIALAESTSLPISVQARLFERIAEHYLEKSELNQAADWLRRANEIQPGAISVLEKMAQVAPSLSEARDICAQIASLEAPHGLLADVTQALVVLRFSPDQRALDEAVSLLEHAVRQRPDWALAHFHLGLAYARLQRIHEAADSFRIAFSFDRTLQRSRAATGAVNSFYRLGRYYEGDVVLDELAEALTGDETVLRLLSHRFVRTRQFPDAIEAAEKLVQFQGSNPASWRILADVLNTAGRLRDALDTLEQARQRHPDNFAILRSSVRCQVQAGKISEAEDLARQAIERASNPKKLLVLAEVLAAAGRKDEAKSFIWDATGHETTDATTLAAAAEICELLDWHDQRIELLRRAISTQGGDPSQSFALARALVASGTPQSRSEAGRIALELQADDFSNPLAHFIQGELAFAKDPPDLDEAHARITTVMRSLPDDPRVHKLLCQIEQLQGRWEDARSTVLSGLAVSPENSELLRESAKIHATLRLFVRAQADLDRLLELEPHNREVLRLAAENVARLGRPQEAVDLLKSNVPEDQRTAEDSATLSILYEQSGQLESAERTLRETSQKYPESKEIHVRLLRFLARQERFSEIVTLAQDRADRFPDDSQSTLAAAELLASQVNDNTLHKIGLDWIDRLAARDPADHANLKYRSAHCCMRHGDLLGAERRFKEALHLDPLNEAIINDLGWMYTVHLDRANDTIALIERYLDSNDPVHPHLLDSYGLALYQLGRFEAARQNLIRCLRQSGQSRTATAATYHLGLVYLKEGHERQGLDLIRQSFELDRQFPGLTDAEREAGRELVLGAQP